MEQSWKRWSRALPNRPLESIFPTNSMKNGNAPDRASDGEKNQTPSPTATSMRPARVALPLPVCLIPSRNRSSLLFPKISAHHPHLFPSLLCATGARQLMLGARRWHGSESSRGGTVERGPLLPETRGPIVVPSTARGVAGDARAGGASCTEEQRELRAGRRWISVGGASRGRRSFVGSFVCTSSSAAPRRLSGGELHRRPGADERNRRGLLVARCGPAEPYCGGGASLVAGCRGFATDALFSMLQ
jgi:hypothetical protein